MRQKAEELGVKIVETSACGDFFEKVSAGGVYFSEENKIGADVKKDSLSSYVQSLGILEHELIHSIQKQISPRMPIELMEYEAYIAGGNMEAVKADPEIAPLVFSMMIGHSVSTWYKLEGEKKGITLDPTWNNADYFIKKN